jgi:hypothetical protein
VSAVTHQLSEDDARWLARMTRVLRARIEARREQEQEHRLAEDEARQGIADSDHDAA